MNGSQFTPIHKQNWKTSAIRNLLLFLNSFFNREIFVNHKESIFFALALNLFGQSSTKIQLCFIKKLQISLMARIVLIIDQNPSLNCRCSVSFLADLVPSLLPFSTGPATVMLALPVLHRSAQYHKLSCFFQPSPFVLSYYALSCPVLSVPHKLTLTPKFCPSPPIPSYLPVVPLPSCSVL
jgi:hypothetical protein